MGTVNVTREQIKSARMSVHDLAGLLTGVSAALFCGRIADDTTKTHLYINKAEGLVNEAQDELYKLRSILHDLEASNGSQSGSAES